MGNWKLALECFEKASRITKRNLGEENSVIGTIYNNIGYAKKQMGKWIDALTDL